LWLWCVGKCRAVLGPALAGDRAGRDGRGGVGAASVELGRLAGLRKRSEAECGASMGSFPLKSAYIIAAHLVVALCNIVLLLAALLVAPCSFSEAELFFSSRCSVVCVFFAQADL